MNVVILGTDTDAGKTTFALLGLAAFPERLEYWKPIETGPSDSALIEELIPQALVHPPAQRFARPAAPALAARAEHRQVLPPSALLEKMPRLLDSSRSLLIESFGSPFSPLTDTDLQLEFLQRLHA